MRAWRCLNATRRALYFLPTRSYDSCSRTSSRARLARARRSSFCANCRQTFLITWLTVRMHTFSLSCRRHELLGMIRAALCCNSATTCTCHFCQANLTAGGSPRLASASQESPLLENTTWAASVCACRQSGIQLTWPLSQPRSLLDSPAIIVRENFVLATWPHIARFHLCLHAHEGN